MALRQGENPSRESVWLQAWLAVANASNSTRKGTADEWADHCLRSFDTRFTSAPTTK